MKGERVIWEGHFSMEVPKRWELREDGELIELVPPDPVGAAHLTVLKRTRGGPVEPGEASELVASFAERVRGRDSASEISERSEGERHTAETSFDLDTEHDTRHWEVGAHVWPERAVVFSYNDTDDASELRETAIRMFRSIELD